MIAKPLLHRMLDAFVQSGGLRVAYWDGDTRSYGPEPDITVHLHAPAAGWAILLRGSLGVGESYMDQTLTVDGPLDRLIKVVADNVARLGKLGFASRFHCNQCNSRQTQRHQIQHHYDIGNEFYRLWLDDSMTYSCAYFRQPGDTLEAAQEQKRRHILRKLRLAPGMTLLDIGSGWGQLLLSAARLYGARGLGITLSREQFELATRRAQAQGLDHLVRFELINFQDLARRDERFDRIVSVGMYEHVGKTNQRLYFEAVKKMLQPDGLSVLHTISGSYEAPLNAWIDRYIFPGGYIPSYQQVVAEIAKHDFDFLDYEDLRMHYATTLAHWRARFEANLPTIQKRYGDRFVRMWRFYLATSEGSFRWRRLYLSQIVFAGPKHAPALTREHVYAPAEGAARGEPANLSRS